MKAFSGSNPISLYEENDLLQVGRNPVFLVATAFSLRNCHRNVTTFYFPVKNGCFWDFLDVIYSFRVVTLSSVSVSLLQSYKGTLIELAQELINVRDRPLNQLVCLSLPVRAVDRVKRETGSSTERRGNNHNVTP